MGSRAFALFSRAGSNSSGRSQIQIRRGDAFDDFDAQSHVLLLVNLWTILGARVFLFASVSRDREGASDPESHKAGRGMSAKNPQKGPTKTNENHGWSAIYVEATHQMLMRSMSYYDF